MRGFDLPLFVIRNRNELNDIHEWLVKSKEPDKYETVCIDSLSEIAEVLLAEEKKVVNDPRQAYGIMSDLMNEAIRGFRDLPKHTLFTAKTRKLIDDTTQRITYMPSVPGQALLNNLPYFFDEVFLLRFGTVNKVKNVRHIQTVGDHQYICKDRSGKLNREEPPHTGNIINKILDIPVKPAGAPAKPSTGE